MLGRHFRIDDANHVLGQVSLLEYLGVSIPAVCRTDHRTVQ